MKQNPRKSALRILNRVDAGAFAEPLLNACLSEGGWENIHDRRLLTQLVYGVLRMRGRLDRLLAQVYRGRFEKMETGLKNILRAGLYQILFMDRIPHHAAVNESVRLAKKNFPGREALVNAVLRNAIRSLDEPGYPELETEPAEHIAVVYSHPLWLVRRWIGIFGVEETLALCRAGNENAPLCIRANRLKASRDALLERLSGKGFEVRPTLFSPDGIELTHVPRALGETELFKKGFFQIQDEGSQLVSRMVDPRAGEQILDACCGVGGKTTHLAELMADRGGLLALDIQEGKLESLARLARRLGIAIIEMKAADAAQDLGSEFHNRFDRVLIDAPCSGLGTLRRNPEIKWRLREEDLNTFPELQRRILESAARYVKPGGILVYSTCTVMPEENEAVIRDFLDRCPGYRLTAPGNISPELVDDAGFFRTYPLRHAMDGFFGAKMVKDRNKGA